MALALVAAFAAAPATPVSAQPAAKAATKPPQHLVGVWSAPTDRLLTAVGDQTVRMVVRTSVGGTGLRIRLSNLHGRTAVTFKSVYLGLQAYGAEVMEGTNRAVTFGGKKSIRIKAGHAVWSDPATKAITPRQDVVVSMYVATNMENVTGHERAYATTYLSDPGDYAADEQADGFTYTSTQWYFLDRVAVTTAKTVRAVAVLGDSLTDGAGQELDANRRWTDYLNHRIMGLKPARRASVLNAGIAGNRVLLPVTGPSGLSRFKRDVLAQPGVATVILFEGINDISKGEYPSANALITAHKKMIKMAHARRLKVVGATLTPFSGYASWTEEREKVRRQFNAWVRTTSAFDEVVDFDKALRDPNQVDQLLPLYDSGDHLHLSDAGRRKLAYSVSLKKIL